MQAERQLNRQILLCFGASSVDILRFKPRSHSIVFVNVWFIEKGQTREGLPLY